MDVDEKKKEQAMRHSFVVCVLISVGGIAQAQAPAQTEAVSFVNEGIVNAPIEDVWHVWSTSDGYKAVGVTLADVDHFVVT